MRSDFKFWEEVVVRWGDMDALGHVNNAKFFTYAESGRLGYMAKLDLMRFRRHEYEGPGLVSAVLNFRKQVRFPDVLELGVRVSEMRTRSFTFSIEMYRKGTEVVVADGLSVGVWVDYRAEKAVSLPEALRAVVIQFEGRADIDRANP